MSNRSEALLRTSASALLVVAILSTLSYSVTPDRILGRIDSASMVELPNHVSPMARSDSDQGLVESSRTLGVTMLFMPTVQQQDALQRLMAEQQDRTSPNYHKWLTPEQYGKRFGLSLGDLNKISAWLQAQGFSVTYVARGGDFLTFEGSAAQVQSALRTEIHNYTADGKLHFANATPPMIPAALRGIVGGFRGLHDFFPHPMLRKHPDDTISGQSTHFLAPGDIATIYDINPLYQLSTPIDGRGQTVVIAGQSDVYLADLNDFRIGFGLASISGCTMDSTKTIIQAGNCASGNFQMVVPTTGGTNNDPGVVAGDLSESDLDIEWMGSVARNAKIIFVTSKNGVDDSASFAIDNHLAPVISYSYGLCEAFVTAPAIAAAEVEYQKASSEGISFFAAAGDSGAAECDGENGTYPAVLGLSVSYPASSPEVTGVGGTEFNESSGNYWGATNGADGGSALSYIPEIAWNDTSGVKSLDGTGGGPSNCAHGSGVTTVSGFPFEVCDAPTSGGFSKPSWQGGITPGDSVRDVPDISFSASPQNDPYIVCTPQSEVNPKSTSSTSTCVVSTTDAISTYNSAFGGTSVSTPIAAGMAVLLNQYIGSGVGPINQQLYTLIYKNSFSVFHDVISGTNSVTGGTSDNVVPCAAGTPSFEPTVLRCPSGGTMGYAAGAGYDLVTGLGSLDIDGFVRAWAATNQTFTLTPAVATYTVAQGSSVSATINLTPINGFNTPVTYTCSVPPTATGATCTGPSGPSAATSVSFQIKTVAPSFALKRAVERYSQIFYAALLPGLLGIVFTVGARKRSLRGMRLLGLIMVLGLSTLWLESCGGSNNGSTSTVGTPKSTYIVTVNATTGGAVPITGSTMFKLTVQ